MKCCIRVCGDVLIVGRGGIWTSETQYLLRINVGLENLHLITRAITHFNNKQLNTVSSPSEFTCNFSQCLSVGCPNEKLVNLLYYLACGKQRLEALLADKGLAGVTPEVNLREHTSHISPSRVNMAAHSGFETQRGCYQNIKTGISVAP